MELNPQRVFAYLKGQAPESDPVHVRLTGDDDLLMRPFVGKLFATLVYDAGDRFELQQRRHLADWRMTEKALFDLGLTNLEAMLASGAVRLHQHGAGYAIIAGGNFEASLLLVDSMWRWVSEHIGAVRLLARAPARDILMVAPDTPSGRAELDALLARVGGADLDHRLSDDLLLWDGTAWIVASGRDSNPPS